MNSTSDRDDEPIGGAVASGLNFDTWRRNLSGQWFYGVVVCLTILLFPQFGDNRVTVSALVLVVCSLQVVVVGWFARRRPHAMAMIPVMDQLLVCLVGTMIPSTFQWGVTITAVTAGSIPVSFGPKVARLSIAFGGIAYTMVGLTAEPTNWVLAVAVFLIASTATSEMVGRVNRDQLRIRNRYSDILEGLSLIVVEAHERTGPLSFVSDQVVDVLGFDQATWRQQTHWLERTHPEDRHLWRSTLSGLATKGVGHCTIRVTAQSGRTVHLFVQLRTSSDGMRGVMIDITDLRNTEIELNALGNFLKQLPTALEVLRIERHDDVERIRFVAGSDTAIEAIGADVGEHPQSWPQASRFVDAWPEHLEQFCEVAKSGTAMTPSQVQWVDQLGEQRTIVVRAFPLADDHVGVTCEDVTEREDAANELRRQATEDNLTGLANRARFSAELNELLAAPGAANGAVLLMDLDQFKEVNDALGHHHGDRLLIELSQRLQSVAAPAGALASRLGGDEFAVIMNGATTREAFQLASKIREQFARPIVIDGISLQTNVSVGVALYPDHAHDADGLLQRADAAMYIAKNGGTGVTLHQEHQANDGVRRLQILSDLRPAINTGQLLLHYQPKVSFETGEVEGLEALVRWQHPTLGMLPPDEFIGLAEVSGLIQDLSLFVIRAAIADATRLRQAGHDLPVAVNLSARNLYYPRLHDVVMGSLEHNKLPPKNFRIELTESELMDDPNVAMDVLQRLRTRGVQVSIDDFGTGYSSLSYLRDLPIDEIKIDRSFVADITGGDDVVVRSIIDLGHALGVDVSAEGVETQQQWHHLRRLGCDVAQGYLISRPLGFDALERFLNDRRDFGVPEWIDGTIGVRERGVSGL